MLWYDDRLKISSDRPIATNIDSDVNRSDQSRNDAPDWDGELVRLVALAMKPGTHSVTEDGCERASSLPKGRAAADYPPCQVRTTPTLKSESLSVRFAAEPWEPR